MKRPTQFLCGAAFLLAAAGSARAWTIESFDVQATVRPDGAVDIIETITADFAGESRHGLYRDIPVHYTDRAGQNFRLRMRVLTIDDGQGGAHPYKKETEGRYSRLRIGRADETVTGRQVYRIIYRVERGAIRFFPDHDEFYWNLTGNEWGVPIGSAIARLRLPPSAANARALGFVGPFGSTTPLTPIRREGDEFIFGPVHHLPPLSGTTAVVLWDKGAVRPPAAWRVIVWVLMDNWIYSIPLFVLFFMWLHWKARGQDPSAHRPVVVQYEPPDELTPAEAGVLLDERFDTRDLTSTVIDLAVRGYLRIEKIEKDYLGGLITSEDYQLVKLKTWTRDLTLRPYERVFLSSLFDHVGEETLPATVKLADLRNKFYASVPLIKTDLYQVMINKGHWDSNPETVRSVYRGIASAVALGLPILLGFAVTKDLMNPLQMIPFVVVCVLSGLIVGIFSFIMPRKTQKGVDTWLKLKGFEEFLARADGDKVRHMNDPRLFERCLSYAMAFGVEDRWVQAFEGLLTSPPNWYASSDRTFNAGIFHRDLTTATQSLGSAFLSAPRSSGGSSGSWGGSGSRGGSSGRGGGGGGGGAW